MTDLVEFLHARIDEDERSANRWYRFDHMKLDCPECHSGSFKHTPAQNGELERAVCDEGHDVLSEWKAAHTPNPDTRALAECEAKRRVIDEHKSSGGEYGAPYCMVCQWDICCDAPKADYHRGAGEFPCRTLRLLAVPHADHEDYREEWKP